MSGEVITVMLMAAGAITVAAIIGAIAILWFAKPYPLDTEPDYEDGEDRDAR